MDGIIFDVDGTLWDSTDTVARSWNRAIRENSDLNLHLTGTDIQSVFGKTMDEIYQIFFPSLSKEEQARLGGLCFEYENALLLKQPGKLYEGVYETVKALSKKTELFIVSNCQRGYIEILLEVTGLKTYIKDHLCFGDTLQPKSRTIRILMERNHLKDVVYVGDTKGDYDACKEAGIPFIFAEYGFGNVPDAPVRIKQLSALEAVLNQQL